MTAAGNWVVPALALVAVTSALLADRRLPPWEKAGDVSRALYREHCAVCHVADRPRARKMGPSLFRFKKLLETRYKPSRDFIAAKVRDGSVLMPAFKDSLTEEQVDQIVAYIAAGR